MRNLIKRKLKGQTYFYLEKNIKIGPSKWKKVSVYLGKKRPAKGELSKNQKVLGRKLRAAVDRFYDERISQFTFSFLSKEQIIEIEKARTNFLGRFEKLSKQLKEKFNKQQAIDFVYTTLRTEGIDVSSEDVETAFKILRKKRGELVLNEKVIISSLMLTGLDFLSKIEVSKKDLLKLHGIVMSYFEGKSPGQLRDDQRVIMRFNPKTFQQEEIKYGPPPPELVEREFDKFFEWFERNRKTHPVELAALTHLKLYTVHPFKDGNKRMCRLIFNKILQDNNYPTLNISKNTTEYFKSLVRSVEEKNYKYFVEFCYKNFLEQVKNKRFKSGKKGVPKLN
ncbi:MAG: Fic family protein [Candidatus Diapherotrites archaeon]